MSHIVDGKFQSDKYPWCQPDFVPLKVTDTLAQPYLWATACMYDAMGDDFGRDLKKRLLTAGYKPASQRPTDVALALFNIELAAKVLLMTLSHPQAQDEDRATAIKQLKTSLGLKGE